MERAFEINFDGLVGPTHNYAGLSFGNIASQEHRLQVSNPRAAAIEGLAKMKRLMDLGLHQAVLPPQHRPNVELLHRVGFSGSDEQVLHKAQCDAPHLLAACCSASSMWAANAATVCPSADAPDGRVYLTAANLVDGLHRAIEADATSAILRRIFADPQAFTHHDPLPSTTHFRDEGAANHTRLCRSHGEPGIQLFVYGASGAEKTRPSRFPARQTLEASQAIARLHGLDPKRTFFAQQNPEAIDAGVFHNDVIAVGHRHVFFHHAQAFVDTSGLIDDLKRRFEQSCGAALHAIEVQVRDVSLSDAVETYLFNSQLIDTPDGKMALICPHECKNHKSVGPYLAALASSRGPISAVQFVNVRQSMQNGGGPACLRLRVVLTESQLSRMRQGVLLTNELHDQLQHWVRRHYRDNIAAKDLSDPNLAEESRAALDELSGILRLGSIYAFQR